MPGTGSVNARRRVAHHRPFAVVDLRLFARRRRDHHACFGHRVAAQLADEALDARVAGAESVIVDELLIDRHGIATAPEPVLDQLAIRLARARRRRAARRRRPLTRCAVGGHPLLGGGIWPFRVGGHPLLDGGIWRRPLRGRPARRPHRDPAAAKYRLIVFRSTPTVAWIRRADHPSRPSAKTCCFFSSPKMFIPGGGTMIPPPRQRLGALPLVADF